MSSNDDESLATNSRKKRKVMQRACDSCRKRKSEEPVNQEEKCSYCSERNIECTYKVAPKKRGLPRGYVEELEQKVRILEEVVTKLCPDKDLLHSLVHHFDPEYATSLTNISAPDSNSSSSFSSSSTTMNGSQASSNDKEPKSDILTIMREVISLGLGSKGDDPFREEEDNENDVLGARLQLLSVNSKDGACRFFGKSSGMILMQAAVHFKNRYAKGAPIKRPVFQNRRPHFWRRLPWDEEVLRTPVKFTFPSPELIIKLSEAYFKHVNLFYPLLHRPTYDRAVADKLHLRDDGFASVFLLVCAVGARYTDEIDMRTLVEGEDSLYSAGWKWYKQVQVIKPGIVDPPKLYDLQIYCLAIHFLTGCCIPQSVWLLCGYGIRLAQDVGVHRRRLPREKLTVEDELWKRAFWVLVYMDRIVSVNLGRPCAIIDEYFDLDMPVECDDEYWELEDSKLRFKQPEGVPTKMTAFIQALRLSKIMTFALTTVYSIKKKCFELLMTSEWEQFLVTELDSALNNWLGALPDHLKWDTNQEDEQLIALSGFLLTAYYYVQIIIHRPFITMKDKPSHLAFPSLLICTNAARISACVLDHQLKRLKIVYPHMQQFSLISAIVLLVNIWGIKRSGVAPQPKAMMYVDTCKNVMRKAEERWHAAGSLLDIMNEFTSVGELILPEDDPSVLFNQENNVEWASVSNKEDNSSCQLDVSSGHIFPTVNPGSNLGWEKHRNTFNDDLYSGSNPSTFDFDCSGLLPNRSSPESSGLPCHPFDFSPSLDMSHLNNQPQTTVDSNTMTMWINAPNGFQINEWNSFFASVAELPNDLGSGNVSTVDGLQEPFNSTF